MLETIEYTCTGFTMLISIRKSMATVAKAKAAAMTIAPTETPQVDKFIYMDFIRQFSTCIETCSI